MAKLTLNNITSGFASTTATNANNDLIEAALEKTLSRDGTSPNTMSADLDMNGNEILNVADMLVGGVGLAASVTSASASAATAVAAKDIAVTSKDTAVSSASSATASAAIVADWDYRGAWVTATYYPKNNIVYESSNGASYICLVTHTSDTFSTDLGAVKWGLLALRGSAGAGTGDMLKSENLSGLANNTAARSNLGAQTADATLTALAAVVNAADQINYATGVDAFSPTPLTAFARTLLDDADAATARATLGVSTFMGTVLDDTTESAARATLGALNLQFMHVRDEKASGTGAGSSVAGNQIRTLNTVVTNTITGASLAANEVTLPAGTYRIFAIAPCYAGSRHRVRLINVTDAAVAILGTGEHAGAGQSSMSTIYGRIVITATKVFNLTHYIATATATLGLGVETSDTFIEVYASMMIWKE